MGFRKSKAQIIANEKFFHFNNLCYLKTSVKKFSQLSDNEKQNSKFQKSAWEIKHISRAVKTVKSR